MRCAALLKRWDIEEYGSMDITDKNIDGGKAFDWGKTSTDYAKFRDSYPQEFYDTRKQKRYYYEVHGFHKTDTKELEEGTTEYLIRMERWG